MNRVRATIASRTFDLDPTQVADAMKDALPDPLDDHYVVVGGRRFPPKQVISEVTGLDRADFNTHQARRVLGRLGFTVGRKSRDPLPAGEDRTGAYRQWEADLLRPYIGRWVAQRGREILVAADTPQAVLVWLERHNESAEAMFRVPESEAEASGAAPA